MFVTDDTAHITAKLSSLDSFFSSIEDFYKDQQHSLPRPRLSLYRTFLPGLSYFKESQGLFSTYQTSSRSFASLVLVLLCTGPVLVLAKHSSFAVAAEANRANSGSRGRGYGGRVVGQKQKSLSAFASFIQSSPQDLNSVSISIILGAALIVCWILYKQFKRQSKLSKRRRKSQANSSASSSSSTLFKVASAASYFMSLVSDTVSGTLEMASASARDAYNTASSTIGEIGEMVATTTGLGSHLLVGEDGIDLNAELDDDLDEVDPEKLEARQQALQRQLKMSKIGGIFNEGNTCFMNSVIQSLASLDSLDGFLDDLQEAESVSKTGPSIVLRKLINDINTKSLAKHTYSTNDLVRSMGKHSSRWMSYDQEDAQEYFQQVLSFLERDVKTTLSPDEKEKPRILSPFDGETAIRVGCLKCGEMEGIRQEVMSSVGLSLTASSPEFVDLLDLFGEYSVLETIPGVECYRCSLIALEQNIIKRLGKQEPGEDGEAAQPLPEILRKSFETRLEEIQKALTVPVIDEKQYKALQPQKIKELGDKSKQVMFARPTARVLAIHINRSVFDPMTGYIRKNLSPVSFAEELDLAPYVVQDVKDPKNFDPRTPMVAAGVRKPAEDHDFSDVTDEEDEVDDLPVERSDVQSPSVQSESTSLAASPVLSSTFVSTTPSSVDTDYESAQSGESDQTLVNDDDDTEHHESSGSHHLASTSLGSAQSVADKSLLYHLKSVIVHYGSHNFGHYICYRKCRHGLWWRVSDQTVAQVDVQQVLSAQGVFMLFYEKDGERELRLERVKAAKLEERLKKKEAEANATSEMVVVVGDVEPSSNGITEKIEEAEEDDEEDDGEATTTATDNGGSSSSGGSSAKRQGSGARRKGSHKGTKKKGVKSSKRR